MRLAKRYFNNLVLVDDSGTLYYSKYENTDLNAEEWLIESLKELSEESEIDESGMKDFIEISIQDINLLQSLDTQNGEVFNSEMDGDTFFNILKKVGQAVGIIFE